MPICYCALRLKYIPCNVLASSGKRPDLFSDVSDCFLTTKPIYLQLNVRKPPSVLDLGNGKLGIYCLAAPMEFIIKDRPFLL